MNFVPREWQTECLQRFQERLDSGADTFVLEACMGAGKSAVAAMIADALLRQEVVDHILVLVPWKSIQGDPEKGMLGAFGKLLQLDARGQFFSSVRRIATQPIPQMDATITLYQEVCNDAAIETLKLWKARGLRIGLICDEIHHANEINGTWGRYIERMKELAEFSVFMSGTFFRSDKNPIACIEMDGAKPIKHFAYTYQRGVKDHVVRTVTTRHINATVTMYNPKSNERYEIELADTGNRELSAAKKQVLDPTGEYVRYMIQMVHEGLMKTRTKFRDAACLFVCRPGNSDDYTRDGAEADEDKHVHLIARQIKELTGENPTVVTHHDKDAVGKIGRFRKGSDPYLVAVNMVSEGCDIPRLRAVAFCRYTDSEMLFRQIVGRALRMQSDERTGMRYEDGTAAQVYIPTFPTLVAFGKQLWDEAQEGVKDRTCKHCGYDPCECPCTKCGERKAECKCPCLRCEQDPCICDEGDYLSPQLLLGLDAAPNSDGGHMGKDAVAESFVQLAQKVANTVVQHMHANPVQFGHFLQAAMRLQNSGSTAAPINPAQERERMARRINRMIRRIAVDVYDKDFAKAYYTEIQIPFREKFKVILETWPVERLRQVEDRLERRTVEISRGGR